jgi:prepilin-type N-terminal cleavage/methylation domain-containing protein
MKSRLNSREFYRKLPRRFHYRSAFTLIEIMIVVAIIGVVMAAGAPTLYRMLHKEGFRKTVGDIIEVCSTARARAILQGSTITVEIRPQDRTCRVVGGSDTGGGAKDSAYIDDRVAIEMVDVNLTDYRSAEVAKVHFFPNGTSDEMTLILRSDKGEWRKIELELTTGLVMPVETDPNKWR